MTTDPELTSSHWLSSTTHVPPPPSLDTLPDYADVIVLGAGIMGSSTAYWLARQYGLSPLVIERNVRPGMGASARNGGLMFFGANVYHADSVKQVGREQAVAIQTAANCNRRLVPALLNEERLDCDFKVTGCLAFAEDAAEEAELKESAAALAADGFADESVWLDRAAAEAVAGTQVNPKVSGALLRRHDAVIHSGKYVAGVAAAAHKRGARFAFGTTVETLVSRTEPGSSGARWVVRTSRGPVRCRVVVACLNAWSSKVFPELAPVIAPVRGHVVLSNPAPFKLNTSFVANQAYEYGRQLETGQILIGGMRREVPDGDVGIWPSGTLNTPPFLPAIDGAIERFLPVMFPATRNLGVARRWTGTMGYTPDGNPICGRMPGRDGVWIMAGFSGHGMPYTQVLPLAIADRVAADLGRTHRPSLTASDGPVPIPTAFSPERYVKEFVSGVPRSAL